MSDEDKSEHNPHRWVTEEVFHQFMEDRGVSMTCERCGVNDAWWIDTGSDGYVPRIAAMPTKADGKAATGDTFQMPIARAVCFNCGNIRLHALQAFDIWKTTGGQPVHMQQSPTEADSE